MPGMKRCAAWLICALSLFFVSGCQDQPLSSLEKARAAVERAAVLGARQFADTEYHLAEAQLQKARLEIARQKGRLAPFRDYAVADSLLTATTQLAVQAISLAQSRRQDLQSRAQTAYGDLQRELSTWRESLDGTLRLHFAERYWSAADLALEMSRALIVKGEYDAAIEAAGRGQDAISKLGLILTDYENEQAQKIKVWRRWVQETLEESRTKGIYALIIDKVAHKLFLVQSGRLVRTYECELGYNSARQKFFAGDGSTPEGQYYVTEAKHHGSRFYKALLINYPNATDRKRFAENKSKGMISARARIGGLIEIHGDGGRNQDWTDGCVALTNKEMDQLMQHAAVGMPVTIVRRSDIWP